MSFLLPPRWIFLDLCLSDSQKKRRRRNGVSLSVGLQNTLREAECLFFCLLGGRFLDLWLSVYEKTTDLIHYKRTGLYRVPAHHLHDTQPTARPSFNSMDWEATDGTDEQDVENSVSAGTEVTRTPATSAQAALPYPPVGGVGRKNSFRGVKSDK